MPRHRVSLVTVEDALAGSVDDVTVHHEVGASLPDQFFQYKYHVDQRGEYSSESLIYKKVNESSLLEKFWRTWQLLRARDPQRSIRLHLVSNWTWDAKDKFKSCIDGRDNSISELFFEASPRSALGKIRQAWQAALKANDAEFREFIGCLRLRLGFDCSDELEKRVAERMEFLGLRSDNMALLVAVGIVRGWVKSGKQELSKNDIERTLKDHDLILPVENEQGVTVYLTTIKAQKFDIGPDYVLDWRNYFVGDQNTKAHELINPADWNGLLLPEIRRLEAKINEDTDSRLVRARGLARLSAWFAFGFTFSDVARYTIEVDQNGRLWRTDAPPSDDFRVLIDNNGPIDGEIIHNDSKTVAVGVSVTGQLNEDVRRYLSGKKPKESRRCCYFGQNVN